MRVVLAIAAAVIAAAVSAGPSFGTTPVLGDVQQALYAARTLEAAAVAERRLAAVPTDDEARFALGAAQFLRAVETLGHSLHRYGLRGGEYDGIWSMVGVPILRIPVPDNPRPEELTYPAARAVLATFVDDLAVAEKTLAAIGNGRIDLPLDLMRVKLDLDGDGKGSDEEILFAIFARVADIDVPDSVAATGMRVDFDQSDVVWLQGYCHLLMAISEVMLAYDWQAAFDAIFPGIFPMPSSPYAKLYAADTTFERLRRDMMALPESQRDAFIDAHQDEFDRLNDSTGFGGIVDLIAFIHLNRWPLVEPERMQDVAGHLLAMVRLSRENWRRILFEADTTSAEWIPSPRQRGIIPGIRVDAQQIQGWTAFLDEFEALLNGRKLMPHWRFEEGVNLRKLFDQPPPVFDIVMMIQGAAVLPYLEKGELTSDEAWRRIERLMGGDFYRYVVWFN